jgi:hypothetical protein
MGQHGMMARIAQNYKLIPEKALVSLADVSQYDADTVEFVQFIQPCPSILDHTCLQFGHCMIAY